MLRNKGFTLIELMIVIAIVGVLAGIMTPSFLSWRDRSKVKGDASELRAVFESAKLRAIKHNVNAVVTFPDTTSYQAFVDTNDNGALDAGEDVITTRTLSPGVTITTITFVGNDMAFNSRGMANGPNSTGRVILTSPGGESYEVVVSSFGRVRLDRL
ncbi:MAG: GspH/FimT family pseudopilin [Desulfobacteraceae bacterium]|jgi:type IV fimbrial biogenesis protein FimT|nr:GspH/FimT family pseudopilin [Desulfobacteraceae bacterium]